jgi:hypothetical protein
MSILDYKYYIECLAKSMALYIVADKFPDLIKEIESDDVADNERNKRVTVLQDKIAMEYAQKYFTFGRSTISKHKNVSKDINIPKREINKRISELYPQFEGKNKINDDEYMRIINKNNVEVNKSQCILKDLLFAYEYISTNHFIYNPDTSDVCLKLIEIYKNRKDDLLNEIIKQKKIIAELTNINKFLVK